MKIRKIYLIFIFSYLLYAIGVSFYLFNLDAGYVPEIYQGTEADPKVFMSPEEINEAHYLDLVNYFSFFLLFPFDLLVLFIFMIFSSKLRDKINRIFKKSFFQLSSYYFTFSFVMLLFYLPLDLFFYNLKLNYDLSNQELHSWLIDLFVGFGLDIVFGSVFLWILYMLIKAQPKKWWLSLSAVFLPVNILAMFLMPVMIMPLFNEYKLLENEIVRKEIHQLAQQADIPDAKILQMDMSKQSNGINAFVTGLGENKMIVIGDNTIEKLTIEELKFVVSHEIGHYVLNHIYQSLIVGFFCSFVLFFIVYKLYNYILDKWRGSWKVKEQHDFANLPILFLAMAIASFPLSPVNNMISRVNETQADNYAIEMTKNKEAAISAFQKLTKSYKTNGYEPDFIHFLLGSHPRVTERIDAIQKRE